MIRATKERVIQTVAYEIGGLLVVIPAYSLYYKAGVSESLTLFIAISILVMIWTGVHNTLFDLMEWRVCQRVASDRTVRYRIIHMLSLELTSTIICVPLILIMTDLHLLEAVILDLVLTFVYLIYGMVFHYIYDYLRPINKGRVYG